MNNTSQCDKILERLQKGFSITPIEALDRYGCFRLASRINDLRSRGYDIRTIIVDNGEKRFAKYYLHDE